MNLIGMKIIIWITLLISLTVLSLAILLKPRQDICNSEVPMSHGEANDTSVQIVHELPLLINFMTPLERILDSLEINPLSLHLEIDKSDYTLGVCSGREILKQYLVVFGGNPVDDKLIEGDQCTPEGSFKVVTKYPHSIWSRFILIDYPNEASMRRFNEAKSAGLIPPDANPGGDIGIHGVPEYCDYAINIRDNWTLGCISLKNRDIIELYEYVNNNTKVIIRK